MIKNKKCVVAGKRLAVETLRQAQEENKALRAECDGLKDTVVFLNRQHGLVIKHVCAHIHVETLFKCLVAACRELAEEPCDRCAP